MRLSEIESPVQNISTHPSLEPRVPRIAIVGAAYRTSSVHMLLCNPHNRRVEVIPRPALLGGQKNNRQNG